MRVGSWPVQTLRRTPLYERHAALGARLVPFAGWEMPVQYSGIAEEHRAVRTRAGVFDVSHMGELRIAGDGAREYLQAGLSNDLDRIQSGEAQYTLLTNDRGGIVDDLIAYRRGDDDYLLVVNAANLDADHAALSQADDVSDDWAYLAVQGPEALDRLGVEIEPFAFREGVEVLGIPCLVAGTGYTGERGCELGCSPESAVDLWDAILERGIEPCGLGARDTLRIEVCYPLHGNDISPEHTPLEAGLGWACALDKDFTGVGRAPTPEGRGAGGEAGRVRHGRPGHSPHRDADRRRRRGHVRHAVSDAGGRHRPRLRPGRPCRARHSEITIDLRGRPRRAAYRPEAVLQARGVLVAADESYPDDLRYHPEHDWARIDGDMATLGITWYAQDALGRDRPLRAARGGLVGRQGRELRGSGVGQGGERGRRSPLRRGRGGECEGRLGARDDQRRPARRWLARSHPAVRSVGGRRASRRRGATAGSWPTSELPLTHRRRPRRDARRDRNRFDRRALSGHPRGGSLRARARRSSRHSPSRRSSLT